MWTAYCNKCTSVFISNISQADADEKLKNHLCTKS